MPTQDLIDESGIIDQGLAGYSMAALDELEIIAQVNRKLTVPEIAKLHKVGEAKIQQVIDKAKTAGALGKGSFNHEERKKLRKQVADYVASGKSVELAAKKFKVKEDYVKRSCKEHGVDFPKQFHKAAKKASQFEIIAMATESPNMSDTQIAESLGVSKQYVSIARTNANRAGLFLAIEKAKQAEVKKAMEAWKKK